MLTEDQRMQMMYTGLARCYVGERALTWSRSQLLTIVNLAALPILISQQVPLLLRITVGVTGVALSLFWHFVNLRMRKRINYWQDRLSEMEPAETFLIVFRVFTRSGSIISQRPRVYAVSLLPWMFIAIWTVTLLVTVIFYAFGT